MNVRGEGLFDVWTMCTYHLDCILFYSPIRVSIFFSCNVAGIHNECASAPNVLFQIVRILCRGWSLHKMRRIG